MSSDNDLYNIISNIEKFINQIIHSTKSQGVVIGLSGGIDSSITAALAVNALGSEKVLGLILPDSRITPLTDVNDANNIAKDLRINVKEIDISDIHKSFMKILPDDNIAEGNLRARIRMCILYYYANIHNKLVIGTGDKSELLIGYFTKYGDGGVDLLPIGEIYKTDVRKIAKILNIPQQIITKKSSPQLWKNHEAEKEIGWTYDEIDSVFKLLFEQNKSITSISNMLNIKQTKIEELLNKYQTTLHKRQLPKTIVKD
tara:strand:- start:11 stop:784 length:774 start_codon:yes stop_codon:yes gene_type:complete